MAVNKVLLRKELRDSIKKMSSFEKERQSRLVFDKLIKHPKYQAATRLSIFLSTENEVDTKPILRHALEVDRKNCFIPFIGKRNGGVEEKMSSLGDYNSSRKNQREDACSRTRMVMIRLKSMLEYEHLPINKYGIKEHKESLRIEEVEVARPSDDGIMLCIVPALGFATDGRRLGHGRGYYDEFLFDWSRHSAMGTLYTIGLAFTEQIVTDPGSIEGQDFQIDEVIWVD